MLAPYRTVEALDEDANKVWRHRFFVTTSTAHMIWVAVLLIMGMSDLGSAKLKVFYMEPHQSLYLLYLGIRFGLLLLASVMLCCGYSSNDLILSNGKLVFSLFGLFLAICMLSLSTSDLKADYSPIFKILTIEALIASVLYIAYWIYSLVTDYGQWAKSARIQRLSQQRLYNGASQSGTGPDQSVSAYRDGLV